MVHIYELHLSLNSEVAEYIHKLDLLYIDNQYYMINISTITSGLVNFIPVSPQKYVTYTESDLIIVALNISLKAKFKSHCSIAKSIIFTYVYQIL